MTTPVMSELISTTLHFVKFIGRRHYHDVTILGVRTFGLHIFNLATSDSVKDGQICFPNTQANGKV